MNGAAGCCRRLSVLDSPASEGWGPEPGPRRSPGFSLLGLGRGRGPQFQPATLPAASSARPLPALPPLRWAVPPRECQGRSSQGWSPGPTHPALLSLRVPFCQSVWGPRGRARGLDWPGRGARKEKRSWQVLQDRCDNILPRVWVGKGKNRTLKMGTYSGVFI